MARFLSRQSVNRRTFLKGAAGAAALGASAPLSRAWADDPVSLNVFTLQSQPLQLQA
jgi:hypothetical protein